MISTKIKDNIYLIYIIIVAIFLGVIIAGIIVFYTTFQGKDEFCLGISIKGVNISGMTKSDAKKAIKKYLEKIMNEDLVFSYSNYEYNVPLEQVEANFDIDSAIEYAYSIGRNRKFFGNVQDYISAMMNKIDIDPKLVYNEEALADYMDFLEVSLPDQVEQPAYYFDDGKLIITTGSTGKRNL